MRFKNLIRSLLFLAHHTGEVLNAFTRLFLEPNFVAYEKKQKTKNPLISGPRLGGQVSRPWRRLGPPWPASHPHSQILTSQQAALGVEGHPERDKQAGGCLGKAWPTNGVSSCVGAGLPGHVFPHTRLLVPVCLAAWAGPRGPELCLRLHPQSKKLDVRSKLRAKFSSMGPRGPFELSHPS